MPTHDTSIVFGVQSKITGHMFSDTLLCVYNIMRSNIFFKPEEPML